MSRQESEGSTGEKAREGRERRREGKRVKGAQVRRQEREGSAGEQAREGRECR